MLFAVIILSLALVASFVLVISYLNRSSSLLTENARLVERNLHLKSELQHLENEFDKYKRAQEVTSSTDAQRFELIANRIVEHQSKALREEHSRELTTLLAPLKTDLQMFKSRIEECYSQEAKERYSLGERIKELIEANQSIGRQAQELSTALRGNTKIQGDWGELVLETILEKSGLRKDIEFKVQLTRDETNRTLRNEAGRFIRPDVVVYYPDRGCMIIDSKVSLSSFTQMVNANSEDEREQFSKLHLESVSRHINELSNKNYQDYVGDSNRLDFVMMFIPNEGAFSAAMQSDPNLWQKAYDKRVIITSPAQLIGALRLVAHLWRHDRQTKNALEIAERSGRLYDKFVSFVDDMQRIEKALLSANTSFEDAMKKIRDGRGNLISLAEKIKELGVKTSKQLPSANME